MKTFNNPETLHAPLAGYSHQAELTEVKRWLVLSGQVGMMVDGTLPVDPMEQFKGCLDNIQKNLQAAGMEITDIVKLTMYLVGEFDTEQRRKILSDWLEGHTPCTTLLYVAALATPDLKVEIDVMACE